jgi:hypothetical protein
VVTSPLANAELSHSNVQSTKHEHTNPVYLYSPYQTRVVCIDLARFSLAWLQILARLELTRLPNTPYLHEKYSSRISNCQLVSRVNKYFLLGIEKSK